MAKEIKMHKFGQFIYVDGKKCRVYKAPNGLDDCCGLCDYGVAGGHECGHPIGPTHCMRTIPDDGYFKKL